MLLGDRRFPLGPSRRIAAKRKTYLRGSTNEFRSKAISREWLDWPFFEPRHRTIGEALDNFVASGAIDAIDHNDVDGACRKLVRAMGEAGLLNCAVAPPDGDVATINSRSICLSRKSLAYADGLADFAFAMQGLGSGAIALAGSPELRNKVLPKVRAGEWLAAFALSEKQAGSDVAAMSCAARADGDDYILDGEKTWISNGGIADVYTLFARTGEEPGARGISAFVVFRMTQDLVSPVGSTLSLRTRWRHCGLTLVGFRPVGCLERRVAASRSRCRPSISFGPRLPPLRSGSRDVQLMKRSAMRASGVFSEVRWRTCN